MAEGLIEKTTDEPLADITVAIGHAQELEQYLQSYRTDFTGKIHPWATPSLKNAIGAIQHCISDLKAAKRHIETPEPPIDASFEITK